MAASSRGNGYPPEPVPPLNPLTGSFLMYTTQSPIQRMRMPFLHQGPELPSRHQLTLGLNTIWTNTWNYNAHRYVVDEEGWWINPIAEYGLTDRWAVSFSAPAIYLSGGVMDGFIDNFHRFFGLGDEGRDEAPRNRLYVAMRDARGREQVLLNNNDRGLYGRAPVLSTRVGLGDGLLPLTLKASVSFPALERHVSTLRQQGADAGLSASTALRWTNHLSTSASFAYVRTRESQNATLSLRDWVFSGAINLAYRASSETAWVAQVLQESGSGDGSGSGYDAATTEILLGAQ
ncbi:MAG TPA: DUF3187 family protein, partial [bacterium]